VHVSDGYAPRLGGIERHVEDLAAHQADDGHRVTVVTTVPGAESGGAQVDVIRPEPGTAAGPTRMRHTWAPHAARLDVISSADVVHVHSSAVSPLAYLALATARRERVATVVTMHSLLATASPIFRAADALLGWRADAVVWSAVSEAAARPLRRALGESRPVVVLPNAVDTQAWRICRPPTDPHRVVIANVGRLSRRKRPAQLLRMLRRARSAVPAHIKLEAIIVGDGPMREGLERYVERHGLQEWVRLVGAATRQQIREFYADVDLYVAPAVLESFGIAALEARCAGLPVIARAQGGVADFVTHGEDGLLARDDASLTDALVRLATDPALRTSMRQHASSVLPPFDWTDVLPRTYAVYDCAVARAAAAGRAPSVIAR
jgi:glycosyltransferase involved in cell wall biosynthesis